MTGLSDRTDRRPVTPGRGPGATVRSVELRSAGPSDHVAVERLFLALHRHNALLDPLFALGPAWRQSLHTHLRRVAGDPTGRAGLTLLAWSGDRAVGLLMMGGQTDTELFLHRHWAELLALFVSPSQRGRGLGRHLVAAGVAWAREHGYPRVQLYVTASNEPGRSLYRAAGFQLAQEIWRLDLTNPERTIA